MIRRSFLSRIALAATALVIGDEALEAFERLTHRKVFALGAPRELVAWKEVRWLERQETGGLDMITQATWALEADVMQTARTLKWDSRETAKALDFAKRFQQRHVAYHPGYSAYLHSISVQY